MLIIRRSKLCCTASGIITPVGGRPVHGLRADYSPLSTSALGVFSFFDVLLTVHLSMILVINQLNAQIIVL